MAPRPLLPPRTPRRPRRWAAAALAAVSLSTVLVVAPTPTLVRASEARVRTEHVRLVPRDASRASDAVGVASATSAEGRELRGALTARDRRTSPRQAGRIHAVGVTLPTAPDGPVLVRGRVAGAWTPWFELPFAAGEGPDEGSSEDRPGVHSEPVWLGDADAYELDAPGSLTELDVHVVDDAPATQQLVLASPVAGAAGAPSIASRAAWGARPPIEHPATTADLKLAIVHHTVSGNSYSTAQVPQMIRSVQAYHQDVRGYNDIAYNIVVDRFGRAWEGRAGGLTNVGVGGHSQGFNTGSLGVVVLGDYRSAIPSAATIESVARVIAWKFALHRVDPSSRVPFTSAGSAKYPSGTTVTLPRIVGHRDVQATDCPGGNLYARLGTIRSRVAQLVPSYQDGLMPLLLDPDRTGDGLTDPIEYRPGRVGDGQWLPTADGRVQRSALTISGAFRPIVGDFDGNGYDDIVWHATGSAADFVWWSGPGGTTSRPLAVNGSYVPIAGDFDGNGIDDILWYATGLAADSVWFFRSDRSYVSRPTKQELITAVPIVGRFDANATDDVFFYGPGSADDVLWHGNSNQTFRRADRPVRGWYDPVALDATGDGRDEILWYAPGTTSTSRWHFTSSGVPVSQSIATTALLGRPTVGDFDGDGLDDALIVAAGSSPDAVWYSTPTGIDRRGVTVNGRYAIVAGPMDRTAPGSSDDVLFVSPTASHHLWQGDLARSFVSTQVG